MSVTRDALIEERVAQLQEIRRRRNELVTEMYFLSKRKDALENIMDIEASDEGLEAFVEEMDIVKHPDVANILDLLLPLPQATVTHHAAVSRTPTPRIISRGTTRSASRASPHLVAPAHALESPIPEPPLSPPTQSTVEPDADVEVGETPAEAMEVDEAETPLDLTQLHGKTLPSQTTMPPPDDTRAASRRSRSSTAPLQPEKRPTPRFQTPKSQTSKSRSPAPPEPQDVPPSTVAEGEMDHQLDLQPAITVDESLDIKPTAVATKTEDAADDTLMVDSHYDPPLPIAKIESTGSMSEYLVEAKVAPGPPPPAFEFIGDLVVEPEEEKTVAPASTFYEPPTYTLPPLKSLPPEFHRKGKQRQSRKRDKDKAEPKSSQEWAPLGLNKWSAVLRANPVHKRVSKATKCLSTKEWNVAMTELKLIKTFDRIDALIDAGRWSFRQPKKHRGMGGLTKTHWDYLLDEMKWMRTDFREERKWKLALAYNLAHAVMEWHEAGSLEERVRRGICVLWKRPRPEDEIPEVPMEDNEFHAFVTRDEEESGENSKEDLTPANEDNSDEDSDEEQEREEQRDVLDVLDPANAVREAFEDLDNQPSDDIQPKVEDLEDTSALRRDNTVEAMEPEPAPMDESATVVAKDEAEPSGLKLTSENPMLLGNTPEVGETASSSSKPKLKSSVYGPLREQIIFSDIDTLFLDLDDFDLVKGMSSLSTNDPNMSASPPLPDLSEIFPDMQPFGLLDVPATTGADGKKKSNRGDKDDPNKRTEDTTYMKVMPANDFMFHKATLLGPLVPAKHWDDGLWHDLDETAVAVELEPPSSRIVDESISSTLFDGAKASPSSTPSVLPMVKDAVRRPYSQALLELSRNPAASARAKTSDLVWTPQDDIALKALVDKHPTNWILVSEAFNGARVTATIDKRTPLDCYDRWRTRFGPAEEEHRPPPQTPTTQMTTRGTKRSMSMSTSVSAAGAHGTPGGLTGSETKKRRRHNLMYETIRKAAKKREAAQKANASQRKPAVIHDTHGQYNKMPKLTPAELSRMKLEKDARDSQEAAIQRRRQDELRQQIALQQQQHQQQRMQQVQNVAAQNPGMRTPGGLPPAQGMPQIRTQVNISGQQQRISNQQLLNNARVPNPQVMQAQAAQAQAQARALAAAQAQAQGQAHPGIANSLAAGAAPALTAHLTPGYNTAARPNSTSPGLPQQSPPTAQAVANATSPRPPSAQAIAGLTPQVQASIASAHRTAPALAHYYQNMPNMQAAQLTQEQITHAMQIRSLISQQQAVLQQQQAQQQAQQQPQQNGTYSMP